MSWVCKGESLRISLCLLEKRDIELCQRKRFTLNRVKDTQMGLASVRWRDSSDGEGE